MAEEKNRPHFSRIWDDIFDCTWMDTFQRAAFFALRRHIDYRRMKMEGDEEQGCYGVVYPSAERIGAEMGNVSGQTAGKYIAQLVEMGVIDVWQRGNQQSNEYVIYDFRRMWRCKDTDELRKVMDDIRSTILHGTSEADKDVRNVINKAIEQRKKREEDKAAGKPRPGRKKGFRPGTKKKEAPEITPAKTMITDAPRDDDNSSKTKNIQDKNSPQPEKSQENPVISAQKAECDDALDTVEKVRAYYQYDRLVADHEQRTVDFVIEVILNALKRKTGTVTIRGSEMTLAALRSVLLKMTPEVLSQGIAKYHAALVDGSVKTAPEPYCLSTIYTTALDADQLAQVDPKAAAEKAKRDAERNRVGQKSQFNRGDFGEYDWDTISRQVMKNQRKKPLQYREDDQSSP